MGRCILIVDGVELGEVSTETRINQTDVGNKVHLADDSRFTVARWDDGAAVRYSAQI